jgi:hypothetical protein
MSKMDGILGVKNEEKYQARQYAIVEGSPGGQ